MSVEGGGSAGVGGCGAVVTGGLMVCSGCGGGCWWEGTAGGMVSMEIGLVVWRRELVGVMDVDVAMLRKGWIWCW